MVVDMSAHVKGGGPQDAPRDGALAVISLKALDSPVRPQVPGGCRHGLAVHATTAYNVAVFSCAVYFVNLVLDDVRRDGSVSILNWPILARSFSPSTLAHLLALWLVVNAGVVVANVGFRCWRCGRDSLPSPFVWDSGWVLAALLLHVAVLVVPVVAAYSVDLPASATCALCFEQARLLMKSYAYLREHVRGALACPRVETNDSLGHLLYYMFAPTLLYSDAYERALRVRPLALVGHAAVFLAAVFTMVVVAGRGALRPFCGEDARLLALWVDLGAPRYGYQLALLVLRALPAGAVLAVGASMALHHWHRVFAEAMRFRARAFTRAWWNAACYAEYFRDWNQIVKAWLNKYVFKEMLTLGFSSMTSKLATVAVSAVWHEYIVAASLGYFLPYFFSFYVISAVIVLIEPPGLQKKPFGNLFVILTLSGGIASILSIYFMESTARQNCPQIVGAPWDFFVPRSVICEEPFKNCTFL